MSPIEMTVHSPEETHKVARVIASMVEPVDCLMLYGDVGAGKTTFMRALIQALSAPGEAETVISPSFMIMQEYQILAQGKPTVLWHIDGYRIEHEEEVYELGLEELAESAILCVEWPEKCVDFLPQRRLAVTIMATNGEQRIIQLTPAGEWAEYRDRLEKALYDCIS